MSDVDAILASGRYTDRSGTWWGLLRAIDKWADLDATRFLTPDQMRALIVRDLHRAVCPGLRDCDDHPVPHVVLWSEGPAAHDTRTDTEVQCNTLTKALNAARHMTGEQK